MRNPKWTQDEVILTLDFYFRHRDNERLLRKTYEPIQQLSETLNRLADTRQIERLPSFRNVNGLIRYLGCIAVLDPNWTRNEWRGRAGKIFEETWLHLGDKPDEVAALAQSILAHLEEAEKTGQPLAADIGDTDIDMLAPSLEGRVLQVSHLRRESNPRLVEKLKDLRFDAQGFLDCDVCAFDYERSYGSRGHKFMEAHHRKPLSSLKPEGEKVHAADYALICANCHRMIHRFSPWWTVEEFREGLAINA